MIIVYNETSSTQEKNRERKKVKKEDGQLIVLKLSQN